MCVCVCADGCIRVAPGLVFNFRWERLPLSEKRKRSVKAEVRVGGRPEAIKQIHFECGNGDLRGKRRFSSWAVIHSVLPGHPVPSCYSVSGCFRGPGQANVRLVEATSTIRHIKPKPSPNQSRYLTHSELLQPECFWIINKMNQPLFLQPINLWRHLQIEKIRGKILLVPSFYKCIHSASVRLLRFPMFRENRFLTSQIALEICD